MGKISLLFLISHGSEVFVLAQGMLITITVSYGGDIIKQLNIKNPLSKTDGTSLK